MSTRIFSDNIAAETKVLVVGTTTDYIDWIRTACPGQALFLTDPRFRLRAEEPAPWPEEELLCDLGEISTVRRLLVQHLTKWDLTLDGIVCFDCESLELAALLARDFALPFPSPQSIRLSRDKYRTKKIWQSNHVGCPEVRLIRSAAEVRDFMEATDSSCVLKPLSGSGSELVFHCQTTDDCQEEVRMIREGLRARAGSRLYLGSDTEILAETWVGGTEYSCDFLVTDNSIEIIRLTRKLKAPYGPFGTIMAYALVSADTPPEFSRDQLEQILAQGASALEIFQAICMVDFIVDDGRIILLEMTPRPGGDCLPHLLRRTCQLDMLRLALDFARRKSLSLPVAAAGGVALRVHADRAGYLRRFDSDSLSGDPRVLEINMVRRPDHEVVMPPDDYDSWYLGHVLFEPAAGEDLENQCREIRQQLVAEIS